MTNKKFKNQQGIHTVGSDELRKLWVNFRSGSKFCSVAPGTWEIKIDGVWLF